MPELYESAGVNCIVLHYSFELNAHPNISIIFRESENAPYSYP